MARVATFRAGHVEGARAATQPHLMSAHAAGSKVLLADISEFQADINDAAYLQWSRAVVVRAMYGANHVDRAWRGGGRRDALHAGGVRFCGLYQYVVASQDPIAQAAALVEMTGPLRQGEVIIGDFEEGSGNMTQARRLWASTVAGATGDAPWSYSGLSFAQDHGLAPVEWVAAYQPSEPGVAHKLWQFTDRFQVPGVGGADCSVFHGTIDQLAALAHQAPKPKPAVRTWRAQGMLTLSALAAADLHETVAVVLAKTCLNSPGHVFAPALAEHIDGVFAADSTACPAGSTWWYPHDHAVQPWSSKGQLSLGTLASELGTTPAAMLALTVQKAGQLAGPAASYIEAVFSATPIHLPAGVVISY